MKKPFCFCDVLPQGFGAGKSSSWGLADLSVLPQGFSAGGYSCSRPVQRADAPGSEQIICIHPQKCLYIIARIHVYCHFGYLYWSFCFCSAFGNVLGRLFADFAEPAKDTFHIIFKRYILVIYKPISAGAAVSQSEAAAALDVTGSGCRSGGSGSGGRV